MPSAAQRSRVGLSRRCEKLTPPLGPPPGQTLGGHPAAKGQAPALNSKSVDRSTGAETMSARTCYPSSLNQLLPTRRTVVTQAAGRFSGLAPAWRISSARIRARPAGTRSSMNKADSPWTRPQAAMLAAASSRPLSTPLATRWTQPKAALAASFNPGYFARSTENRTEHQAK